MFKNLDQDVVEAIGSRETTAYKHRMMERPHASRLSFDAKGQLYVTGSRHLPGYSAGWWCREQLISRAGWQSVMMNLLLHTGHSNQRCVGSANHSSATAPVGSSMFV